MIKKTFILPGKTEKPIVTDVFYQNTHRAKPVVIFCHGYKGFKDWGAWNLVAQKFAENGFFFIKFNFSHNGGTPENPIDFPDLTAFSEDNFSIQLDDLETVIDWILTTKAFVKEADVQQINLIGHSRGGGIVLIKSGENDHISQVATWAGVSNFASRFPNGEALEKWEKEGVSYVENSRTHQKMPHKFQFYQDFKAHEDRFTIKRAVKHLSIPQLIIHAEDDTTVAVTEARELHTWNPKSKIELLPEGRHTFATYHPWNSTELSPALVDVTTETITFFKHNASF